MRKRFELEFSDDRRTIVTAELLEDMAPIACANLWDAMAGPFHARLHHGRHCAAELWCYLPQPAEAIPFENSTVFPETGDILYYHFIQPPTRRGRWVCDLGIFYSQGQSRLPSGWLPGNRVARVCGGDAAIRQLELIAADLLQGRVVEVVLRRRADAPGISEADGDREGVFGEREAALAGWLACWDALPMASTEADITRMCAGAEQYAKDVVAWLDRSEPAEVPADRAALLTGARRVAELAAWWRFATDQTPPAGWREGAVTYWRAIVRQELDGGPPPEVDRTAP